MKRFVKIMTSIATVYSVTSCGTINFIEEDDRKESQQHDTLLTDIKPRKKFVGYVNSAFEVTVDGETYADMEDFYTKELERLPQKVAEAGYGDEWDVKLDAEVGLSDLWNNMKVFVAPQDGHGHQSLTRVRQGGKFSFTLPEDALDNDYKVRAVKRINIILTSSEEQKKICYNFSAYEDNVEFSDESRPTVLDEFSTRITAYDCTLADDKLDIPQREDLEIQDNDSE